MFDYCPLPFDFEEVFRESQEQDLKLEPDIFFLSRFGRDATWDMMASGVQDPTRDGVGDLNWGDPDGVLVLTEEPIIYPFPGHCPFDHEEGRPAEDGETGEQPNTFRRGGLNDDLKTKLQRAFAKVKLEALLSGLADSARVSYQSSRMAWGRFCFVRGIPICLTPGEPGWDEPLLDFLIWTIKVTGRRSSTLKTRFAAIRFTHLVNGNLDFPLQAHRAKAVMKGLKKREGVQRKHPFNTDLLRWMQAELVTKGGRTQ